MTYLISLALASEETLLYDFLEIFLRIALIFEDEQIFNFFALFACLLVCFFLINNYYFEPNALVNIVFF